VHKGFSGMSVYCAATALIIVDMQKFFRDSRVHWSLD